MSIVTSKSQIDLIKIAEFYTELISSGEEFKTCCPLPNHNENEPSCHFNPTKQFWFCYGCQKGGDVFDFLMLLKQCSFKEALVYLKEEHNIDYQKPNYQFKNQSSTNEYYNAAQMACSIFHGYLKGTVPLYDRESNSYEKAIQYLTTRGFDLGDINRWELGFCPHYPFAFSGYLEENKMDFKPFIDLGIITETGKNVFSGRLIIPIFNIYGKVIGFNGRRIDGYSQKKYINSNNNEIFHKKNVLFNIDKAKQSIRSLSEVILVEGPLDAIRLSKLKISNVVATMGTALTTEQKETLNELGVRKVIISGDGDVPGYKASIERGLSFLQDGTYVQLIDIPNNQDPDCWGKEDYMAAITAHENPINFFDFLSKHSTNENAEFVFECRDLIASISDPILRQIMIKEAQSLLGISLDVAAYTTPTKLRKYSEAPKENNEIKAPRIQLDIIYVLLYHWKKPAVAEMLLQISAPEVPPLFSEIFTKAICEIADRMEICNGAGDLVRKTTRFSNNTEALILKAEELNQNNTEVDWNLFLLNIGKWIVFESVQNKINILRRQILTPQSLDDSITIFNNYLQTKREMLQ